MDLFFDAESADQAQGLLKGLGLSDGIRSRSVRRMLIDRRIDMYIFLIVASHYSLLVSLYSNSSTRSSYIPEEYHL